MDTILGILNVTLTGDYPLSAQREARLNALFNEKVALYRAEGDGVARARKRAAFFVLGTYGKELNKRVKRLRRTVNEINAIIGDKRNLARDELLGSQADKFEKHEDMDEPVTPPPIAEE